MSHPVVAASCISACLAEACCVVVELHRIPSAFLDFVAVGPCLTDLDGFRRMLVSMSGPGKGGLGVCDSLARILLSVGLIQSDVANILLEKLPEHVTDLDAQTSGRLPSLMESTARLILSQFRWLDYLVDSRQLTEKLVQVVSICPVGLKKEMITFLPEIVVDQDHEMLLQALQQMLEEDMQLITAVLDAFSNLNLDEHLFETASVSSLTPPVPLSS